MRADVCKRVRVGVEAVRAWPIWELPRWLVAFILAVGAIYFAAASLSGSFTALKVANSTAHGWPSFFSTLRI